MNLGPDDQLHLEGFGLGVFAKADKQDRANRADLYETSTSFLISDMLVLYFEFIIVIE